MTLMLLDAWQPSWLVASTWPGSYYLLVFGI